MPDMRPAPLGGTGRIGGHVLTWALEAGHPVTALAFIAATLTGDTWVRSAPALAY